MNYAEHALFYSEQNWKAHLNNVNWGEVMQCVCKMFQKRKYTLAFCAQKVYFSVKNQVFIAQKMGWIIKGKCNAGYSSCTSGMVAYVKVQRW